MLAAMATKDKNITYNLKQQLVNPQGFTVVALDCVLFSIRSDAVVEKGRQGS